MDLLDMIADQNKPEPIYAIGDTVYILSLDVVTVGTVKRMWLCRIDDDQYYGYDISLDAGHNHVTWDHENGLTLFKERIEADAAAANTHYEKITLSPTDLTDCVSVEYIRDSDGYKLTATIAKYGDLQLYEHSYMCYHFLQQYESQKKRDDAYKKLLKKAQEESTQRGGTTALTPFLDVLYRVSETLYASRGFAEHHIDYRLRQFNH